MRKFYLPLWKFSTFEGDCSGLRVEYKAVWKCKLYFCRNSSESLLEFLFRKSPNLRNSSRFLTHTDRGKRWSVQMSLKLLNQITVTLGTIAFGDKLEKTPGTPTTRDKNEIYPTVPVRNLFLFTKKKWISQVDPIKCIFSLRDHSWKLINKIGT